MTSPNLPVRKLGTEQLSTSQSLSRTRITAHASFPEPTFSPLRSHWFGLAPGQLVRNIHTWVSPSRDSDSARVGSSPGICTRNKHPGWFWGAPKFEKGPSGNTVWRGPCNLGANRSQLQRLKTEKHKTDVGFVFKHPNLSSIQPN